MLEERLEQVREIDGEQAYEKMRRAVEKASQEKARQETARQSRDRRGPERGGAGAGLWPQPLVLSAAPLLSDRHGRMGRADFEVPKACWKEAFRRLRFRRTWIGPSGRVSEEC